MIKFICNAMYFLTVLGFGFLLYPLLFVPLGAMFFPDFMEKLVLVYADYLRIWGF